MVEKYFLSILLSMPTRRVIPFSDGIYFITFTCCKWMPLIEITQGYDIIYKWFDIMRDKGNFILGFVVMPNHVHVLIGFKNSGIELNKIIGNGKRFMAYGIVRRLLDMKKHTYLKALSDSVSIAERNDFKYHKVWAKSFNWKLCNSDKMINQKLDYIHSNPCSGKWNLSKSPIHYRHSSAGFYYTGNQGVFPVTNFMQLRDIDLTSKIINQQSDSNTSPPLRETVMGISKINHPRPLRETVMGISKINHPRPLRETMMGISKINHPRPLRETVMGINFLTYLAVHFVSPQLARQCLNFSAYSFLAQFPGFP